MSEIVLASGSPRRQELLSLLGLIYSVEVSNFDESTVEKWPPEDHAIEAASGKALDVAARITDGIVIGADTVVVVDRIIMGKPETEASAIRMLELLSGRSHYVYTGLCVVKRVGGVTSQVVRDYVRTEVMFDELTQDMIAAYVATGEPMDKAGAYGIQERGCVLVEGIVGDYFNVVGLPVHRLSRLLVGLGVPLFG